MIVRNQVVLNEKHHHSMKSQRLINIYIDPLSGMMTSGNEDVSQTTALSEPRYSPYNPLSSLANSVTPTALATLSQCKQLCAISRKPTASVSSS